MTRFERELGRTIPRAPQERAEAYRWQWRFLHPKNWLMWVWFLLLWTVTRLPYSWVAALGRSLGRLFYRVAKKRRNIALRNVELCFPEKSELERDAIVRESFEGMGQTLLDSGVIWWDPFNRAPKLVELVNEQALLKALKTGRPVLMVGMHNLPLEQGYVGIADLVPFSVIYRVHDNALWEYVAGNGRSQYQLSMMGRKSVRQFLLALESGSPCLIVPDQDLGKRRSVFIPWFGIDTAWVTSVAEFAEKTDACVLFCASYRERRGDKHCVLEFFEPFENFPSGNIAADTAKIAALTEEQVRLRPGQYLWAHRRFKSRPDGAESLY